ncbi:MAG: hypothetical protein E7582_02550 [Ruminococcaceae bacterium]|nr:hypothetical protein [Oscillospiraceae bacterium]
MDSNKAELLVDLFDTIADETGISVKSSKGNYFNLEEIISCLSGIWKYLDRDKKLKISEAFVELCIDYELNKLNYEKLSKKTRTLPLIAVIYPEEDTTRLHIIYDRIDKKFILSDKATTENLMSCWHFKPTFDSSVEGTLDYLNSIPNQIKGKPHIRDFLLQNIKLQEIYLQF